MEAKVKVLRIGATELVGEKSFKKRELIVESSDNPQYPQILKFEASQAKCDLLDTLNPGDEINVHFNLNGREWTNKEGVVSVFNTLAIWKFDVISKNTPAADPTKEPPF